MKKVAFDTNVLVYAELEPQTPRGILAHTLILKAATSGVMPVQVTAEFLRVIQRKAHDRFDEAVLQIARYAVLFSMPPTTADTIKGAVDLVRTSRFQFFDAMIVTAAASAGAGILLSEDMQDGRHVAGLRILNPFDPANAAAVDALFPV